MTVKWILCPDGVSRRSDQMPTEYRPDSPDSDSGHSVAYYFTGSGETMYQNSRGRCEDAPCCGCCS